MKTTIKTVTLTESDYHQHCNDYDGLCLNCLEFTVGGVEPDAENYMCADCGATKVVGTEQALMMGVIEITEEAMGVFEVEEE